MKKKKILPFLISICLFVNVQFAYSQIPSGGGAERSDKNISFMPIPYVNYNRSLGFQIGFLPMVMYNLSKKDTISPSSISGGFGMYSGNKTWFAMQFNKLYFKEDRYRAILVGGTGDYNSQFFWDLPVFNDFIDYSTKMTFLKVELQRRVIPHLFVGLNYMYAKLITEIDLAENPEEETNLNSFGAIVSYDRRDDVYYPHKGFLTNLLYSSFPEFLGNDFVSEKITVDFNQFFEMKNERDIVAVRFYGGAGIGELNFNQQFVVGNNDIRGYTQSKYRGDQIVSLQAEYRWNPFKKIGFVGFGGIASVFSGLNADDNGKILPGIGTGFRYNVFPKNHMNVGMDIAAGIDDWGIYFKIGEAF